MQGLKPPPIKTFICDNHLNCLKLWAQIWGHKPNKRNKKHTCTLNTYLVQLLSFSKPPPPLPRHHSTPWITPVLSLPPSFSTSFITHHSHLTALTHSRCFNLEWTRLFCREQIRALADTRLFYFFFIFLALLDFKFCFFWLVVSSINLGRGVIYVLEGWVLFASCKNVPVLFAVTSSTREENWWTTLLKEIGIKFQFDQLNIEKKESWISQDYELVRGSVTVAKQNKNCWKMIC